MADPYGSGTHGAGDPTVHIPSQYPPAPGYAPAGQYSYPPPGGPAYADPGGYGDPTYPPGPVGTPRRRNGLKITLIVLAVVVVLGGAGAFAAYWFLVRGVDRLYTVGNCLDTPALSAPAGTAGPSVVDCADPAAQSRIVAVFDGRTSTDGEALCSAVPGAVAHMQLTLSSGSTKLLCLGEV
jgi:hypothetical protein